MKTSAPLAEKHMEKSLPPTFTTWGSAAKNSVFVDSKNEFVASAELATTRMARIMGVGSIAWRAVLHGDVPDVCLEDIYQTPGQGVPAATYPEQGRATNG
jgi:hypothetical protein